MTTQRDLHIGMDNAARDVVTVADQNYETLRALQTSANMSAAQYGALDELLDCVLQHRDAVERVRSCTTHG